MRIYQTCKMIYMHNQERRDWWQHVKQLGGLEFHATPGMGQYSWSCFRMWRSCELRDAVPETLDESATSNYLQFVETVCSTPSSPSSEPESFDEDPVSSITTTSLEEHWARGPMCAQCDPPIVAKGAHGLLAGKPKLAPPAPACKANRLLQPRTLQVRGPHTPVGLHTPGVYAHDGQT